MAQERIGYVIACSKVSKCLAIREFVDRGRGELDYEVELDEVCDELDWECTWAATYGKLTFDKVKEIVSNLMS